VTLSGFRRGAVEISRLGYLARRHWVIVPDVSRQHDGLISSVNA